jgi:hypothetical protein
MPWISGREFGGGILGVMKSWLRGRVDLLLT